MFLIRRFFSKSTDGREPQLKAQRQESQDSRSAKELLSKRVAEANSLEERVALWTRVVRKAHQDAIVELSDTSDKANERPRSPQLHQSDEELVIEADSEVLRDPARDLATNAGTTTTLVVWNGDQSSSESSETQLSEDEVSRSAAYRTHADYFNNSLSTEASESPIGLEDNFAWHSVSESQSESEAGNIVSLTSSSGSQSAALRSLEHAFGLPESEELSDSELTDSEVSDTEVSDTEVSDAEDSNAEGSNADPSDSEVSASEPDSFECDLAQSLCSQLTTVSSTPSSSETDTQEFEEESDLDEAKSNEYAIRYLNAVSDPWEPSVSNAASDEEPEEEDARDSMLDWSRRTPDSITTLKPAKTPKHFRFHNETGLLMELSQEGRHKRFWHDEFSEVKDEQEFAQLFGLCTQRQRAKRSRKF